MLNWREMFVLLMESVFVLQPGLSCVECRYCAGECSEISPCPHLSRGSWALGRDCSESILEYCCSWCDRSVNCHDSEFKQSLPMQTCCSPTSLLGNDPNTCSGSFSPCFAILEKTATAFIFSSLIYPLLVSELKTSKLFPPWI